MIAKTITYQQLHAAIIAAFDGDKDILELYDPAIKIECTEDIAKDIIRKVATHQNIQIKGIFDKNKLVGYFVRGAGILISFGLAVSHRARKFKREFFDLIKRDFKGMFVCFLWSRNVRAIRFLSEKCGMQILDSNHLITKLICH